MLIIHCEYIPTITIHSKMMKSKLYKFSKMMKFSSLALYFILLIFVCRGSVATSQSALINDFVLSRQNNRTIPTQDFVSVRVNSKCKPKTLYPLPPRFPFTGKKGIGLTLRSPPQPGTYIENLPKVLALDVDWNYGWSINRIVQQPDVPVFIPMIWGGKRNTSDLNKYIDASNLRSMIQQGKVTHVLGFNEPDERNQSNMTVDEAIDRWSVLESLGVPLVSPSCLRPGSQWMIDFMAKATEECLRVDYLGVHWYGSPNITAFKEKILSYWQLHKMPVVITEFAPADWDATTLEANRNTPAEVLKFMKGVLPWLERRKWVYGYSWYPFKADDPNGWSSALFFSNGTLTAVGRYYKSVRYFNVTGDKKIRPDHFPF